MKMDKAKKKELMQRLRGVSIPLITPLKASGEVDENGFRKNIQYMIEKGICEGQGFLLVLGSTGEFPSFSKDEAVRIAQIGVKECKGKVPVIVGCNHSNIKDVIEFGNYVAGLGVDAILVRPVYYWGVPSEEMILSHYGLVAKEVPAAIVVYNRCLSNVVDIPTSTAEKLAEMDAVVALKDGTSSLSKFDKTVKALTGKISVINGWGEPYEPYTLLMGTDGFLSVAANFMPEISLKLFKLAESGDFVGAEKIHRSMCPMLDTLFSGTYGQFIGLAKYAAEAVGLAGGPTRRPLPPPTEEQKAAMKKCLQDLGLC
jgi:4-hydroxy-tetrahydrodipicolinate synthase